MKKAVLFICVLISIYSCNTKKKETDLDKMGLKGDVVFVFVLPDEDEDSSFDNLEFDNNGNLIRKIDYMDYDNTIRLYETSFIRDNSNKIISENELTYSDANDLYYHPIRKKYSYDNDKVSTVTYQNKLYTILEKYKYEGDKLIEIKKEKDSKTKDEKSSIETTSYFYNKNNHLDSTIIIQIEEDGHLFKKNLNTYLQNGLLKSEKGYLKMSSDYPSILSLIEFKYNEKNDIIEEKTTYLKEKFIILRNYTYVYDDKNNWIERTGKYHHSNFKDDNIEVIKRRIFYKGQNYSEFISKYDLFIMKYKSSSIEFDGSSSQLEEESNSVQVFHNQDNENQVSNYTPQQQEKRKCSSCKGTGKCSTCMKTFRVHYWAGKNPGWKNENETRPGKVMCNSCHGAGVIYGRHPFGEDPEYEKCHVGGCNNGWKNCPECNNSGNGNNLGQCKACKGTGFDR
jgi:hypothetical protein